MKIPFIKQAKNEVNIHAGAAISTGTYFPDIYGDAIQITTGRTNVQLPAVKQAVNIISDALTNMPLMVVDKDGEQVENTNLEQIINKKPNDYMGSAQFKKFLYEQFIAYGNGIAVVNYSSVTGRVSSIEPAILEKAQWRRDLVTDQFMPVYKLKKLYEQRGQEYTRDEIIHLAGDGFDGLLAKNPMDQVKIVADGMIKALNMFIKSLNANVNGVKYFEIDREALDNLGPEAVQEFLDKATDVIQQSSKKGSAILPMGIKLSTASIGDSIDQSVLSYMEYATEEVARTFNIGPRYLGITRNIRIANELSQMGEDFLRITLMPRVLQINEQYGRFLAKDNVRKDIRLDWILHKLPRVHSKNLLRYLIRYSHLLLVPKMKQESIWDGHRLTRTKISLLIVLVQHQNQ